MKSESKREAAAVDLVKILNYLNFDTMAIEQAINRGELDHVKDLAAEAIAKLEQTLKVPRPATLTEMVDRSTGMRRTRDGRSRSPRKLFINVDDSRPIRIDRPGRIVTSVRKVRGPQISKANIEKSMDEFIPSRWSGRIPLRRSGSFT